MRERADGNRRVKCLVWDLDNTLWDGVLLEDEGVTLRAGADTVLKTLDQRGILHSIASKNEAQAALGRLRDFGLSEYFLYPQIGWGSKVPAIKRIAQSLDIGLDALAFIDDQEFEREEVRFSLPEVLCLDAVDLDCVLDRPELNPPFITEDAANRRKMYMGGMARSHAEEDFQGAKEEFLASLSMVLTIFPAQEADLRRAEELTLRTNQLNATGFTYSYAQLEAFRRSSRHRLLVARLEDRFGSYGHVGLVLVERGEEAWTLKLLLVSCRVMGRGVATGMLVHVMNQARSAKVRLYGELVPTGRNRMMEITYRFMGFREARQAGQVVVLEHELAEVPSFPPYLAVNTMDDQSEALARGDE